jgi:uncharacterized cupredoxin-like copper-binding protein
MLVLTGTLSIAAACGGGSSNKTLKVQLDEYSIKPSTDAVKAGKVRLDVQNIGDVVHEVVIVRAGAADKLPKKTDGSIDEDKIVESDKAGEVKEIGPGATKSNTFDLSPGAYVLFCNLVDDGNVSHFSQGMSSVLKVN